MDFDSDDDDELPSAHGPRKSSNGQRARRGVRDGSDRIARIGRWLHNKPSNKNVVELGLFLDGGQETLARWKVDEVFTELAPSIDALLLDAANDSGTTVSAQLTWLLEDGSPWLTKGFRARPDKDQVENVRPLDGSMASIITQMQRHNEAYASQLALITTRTDDRWERVLGLYERTIENLAKKVEVSEQVVAAAQEREAEALDLAETAAERAEAAQHDAEEAREQKDDPLAKVIEITAKQLMSGGVK